MTIQESTPSVSVPMLMEPPKSVFRSVQKGATRVVRTTGIRQVLRVEGDVGRVSSADHRVPVRDQADLAARDLAAWMVFPTVDNGRAVNLGFAPTGTDSAKTATMTVISAIAERRGTRVDMDPSPWWSNLGILP